MGKRDKEAKKRAKERNRPIVVGNQRFLNVGALRGKVKEILNSRSDGEQLKKDGTDFKLITSLLAFHPQGPEKSKGLAGIKVAKSERGDNRCFYVIREDGSHEDVSMKKCVDAVEANPPYVKVEKKEPEKNEGEKKEVTLKEGEAKLEEKKEDTKQEEKKEDKLKEGEAKPEEKKEDTKERPCRAELDADQGQVEGEAAWQGYGMV